MNLWVKRTGQLLLAAMFLMACEDESSLLGFRNPNKKFDVNFVDIPLETSVVLVDSIRSDNQTTGVSRLLAGRYFDPVFGEVTATAFAQLRPDFLELVSPDAVYDSLVLHLQLDFYAYGSSGISQESISVHEITEDSISYSLPFKPYYPKDKLGYSQSLGETTFSINYDSLKKRASLPTPDTTYAVRIKFDGRSDFGPRLFNLLQNNPDSTLNHPAKFTYAIKGLALTAGSSGNSIIGFNRTATSRTVLTLHYHTPNDTLTRAFFLDRGSFNNIETNRIGELSGNQPYESFAPPSGLRYLQNGSTALVRFDMNNFYEYMADIPNSLINAADLIIESVEDPGVYTPPQSLTLRAMREDNLFYKQTKATDKDFLAKYWLLFDGDYYIVRSDISSSFETLPTTIRYSGGKYSGNFTLFIQDLFSKKDLPEKLRYLGFYSANAGKTVDRVVFNQNKVKLRVYYTVPTNQ